MLDRIKNKALVNEIVRVIRDSQEFSIESVALCVGQSNGRDFGIAFSQANTVLHGEGLGFVPKGGRASGGVYVRATTQQKIGRAARARTASARKLARQYLSLQASNELEIPEQDRDGFRRAVEKNGQNTAKVIAILGRRSNMGIKLPTPQMNDTPRGRPDLNKANQGIN